MEKIDYLIDTYLISIDKKDYMYAHSSGNGFLLNNLDLDSRIKLPKKYIKVRDEGNYLTGFTSKKTIDFISKKDFKIIFYIYPLILRYLDLEFLIKFTKSAEELKIEIPENIKYDIGYQLVNMETEIKTEKEENLIKEIRDKLKLKKVLKKAYED